MRNCTCGGIIKDNRAKNCRSCAVSLVMKSCSPDVNKKISETLKRIGAKPPITHRTDEQNPAWRGGCYAYVHDWIARVAGYPDTCERCSIQSKSHRKIQWSNKDHKYRRIREDWQRLCASCHKTFDVKLKKVINVT